MATSTSAPQLLAYPTENTTAVPSSNSSRTTSQFQQNFPYATGIPTTTFTTTPPSSLHHMTPTTKPGSRNTTISLTGCLHSTGHSFHTTSNSKPKDGNSQSTERISIPGWPPTNVSFDAYGNDNTPSENHTSTLPPSITLSHSSATLPNTQQPPLKQQNNCVPPDPADLPCACNHLQTLLQDPDTPTTNGHYILTLDQLHLPTHLSIFLNANMNSTYYPGKARYFLTFQTAYTKWLRLQGLPPSLAQHLQPFLEHQWRLHNTHLKQQPRFTARLLRQLQEYLGQNTVLHHADHELQQLRLFCPRQYFTGALNTWQSPELFEPLPYLTAANIHDHLTATVPPILRTRYKWGFCKDFNIPYGVVHLKQKKQWQKGRTIISYFHSLSGNLLRITSRRHYPSTPLPPTSRTTVHPTTLAPLPQLPHPNPSRHLLVRHQR